MPTALLLTAWVAASSICPPCDIDIDEPITLGSLDDEVGLHVAVSHRPLVTGDGHLLAIGEHGRSIVEYDDTGGFVRSIGRTGQGPGELSEVVEIGLHGDSLVVFDPANARLTLLTRSGDYLRSFPISMRPLRVKPAGTGRFLVSAHRYAASALADVVDLAREEIVPFGPAITPVEGRPSMGQRIIAAGSGRFWAARPDRYEVEARDSGGRLLHTIDREVEWFPDRDVEGAVDFREVLPNPWVQDLHVDEEGRLWTMVRTADPAYRPSGESLSDLESDRVYDTIVEVFEPSGELLSSRRFPWYGLGFASDGSLVSQRRGPFDLRQVDVWPVRLETSAELGRR